LSKIQVIYPDNRATPPLHGTYTQQGDEAIKKLVRDIFGKPKKYVLFASSISYYLSAAGSD
jgi:hypothetical protein